MTYIPPQIHPDEFTSTRLQIFKKAYTNAYLSAGHSNISGLKNIF